MAEDIEKIVKRLEGKALVTITEQRKTVILDAAQVLVVTEEVKRLRAALTEIKEQAQNAQGDWLAVSQVFAPIAMWEYKEIVELVNIALKSEATNG